MEARVKFCKTITQMFESGGIDENKIVFSSEAHFWWNGYVNKQNYRFWGTENPNISISKSFHPEKVILWAALSGKRIYLYFFDSTIPGNSYKELLETKFFPFAKKRGWIKTFHFMQDGATLHRTKEVFEAIYSVYGNRVIRLGYPKFAHEEIEWSQYSPDLNPCDFFLSGYIKDHCYSKNPTTTEELMKAIRKTVNSILNEILSKVLYSCKKKLIFARVVMVNTSKIFIIKFIDFKKC